jgi:hypothetical protein
VGARQVNVVAIQPQKLQTRLENILEKGLGSKSTLTTWCKFWINGIQ